LGDDREIYAYSGSSIDVISRPASSRYATRYSGICTQLIPDSATFIAAATTDKYYIRLTLLSREPYHESAKHYLFVYDALNRVWWAEDSGYEGLGSLSAISSFNSDKNTVLLAFGDQILKTTREYFGYDNVYNFTKAIAEHHDIEYEFQTRVFGVDGADSRKSISRVWFQASANADVYLSDAWTAVDRWISQTHSATLKKIGALEKKGRPTFNRQEPYEDVYEQDLYEQQVCYVEKMYGQRLNTFQVVVKGTGSSKFYLMKREWGAR